MLKKRVEKLEEQSKNKTSKYKDFNAFYEDLGIDLNTLTSFEGLYTENKKTRKVDDLKEKLSSDELRQEIINRGLPVLDLED